MRYPFFLSLLAMSLAHAEIDRQALVTRHHPALQAVDYDSPFQVGNGGFVFGVDATGLQSFPP